MEYKKFYSLADIEGKISPHQSQIKGALKQRVDALSYAGDVDAMSKYVGGWVEEVGGDGSWLIGKEIYPCVVIWLKFKPADNEFPASLNALYGGDKINSVRGEELATLTISMANQLLRFVRLYNPDIALPAICYKV